MSEEQDIETVSTERTSVQPATLDEAFGMALSMPETEEPQDHFRDMTEHLTYAAEKLHLKREELNRWCNCMSAPGVAFQIPGECGNIPEMTLFDLLALRTRDESVHTAFVRSIIRGSMIFKEEQAQRTAHRSQIQPTPIREMAQDTKSVTSTGSDETLIQFPEDTDSYAGPSHNTSQSEDRDPLPESTTSKLPVSVNESNRTLSRPVTTGRLAHYEMKEGEGSGGVTFEDKDWTHVSGLEKGYDSASIRSMDTDWDDFQNTEMDDDQLPLLTNAQNLSR